MRCDACYGINNAANKYITENNFREVKTMRVLIVRPRSDPDLSDADIYQFEKDEKHFYDAEPEYFNLYENDANDIIREYSQVLFFSSGACEFLALEKFDFEKQEWVVVEESLWKESDVPVGDYSPSLNAELGLFCRK